MNIERGGIFDMEFPPGPYTASNRPAECGGRAGEGGRACRGRGTGSKAELYADSLPITNHVMQTYPKAPHETMLAAELLLRIPTSREASILPSHLQAYAGKQVCIALLDPLEHVHTYLAPIHGRVAADIAQAMP